MLPFRHLSFLLLTTVENFTSVMMSALLSPKMTDHERTREGVAITVRENSGKKLGRTMDGKKSSSDIFHWEQAVSFYQGGTSTVMLSLA